MKENFKEELEESLDRHFPKGECIERGNALMLFAEAVMIHNRIIAEMAR